MQSIIYNGNYDYFYGNDKADVVEKMAGETCEIDFSQNPVPICGDVEIYLNHLSVNGKDDRLISRLRVNTAFLND